MNSNAVPRPKKHIVAPQNCTGCGLCANVCSKAAISMVWSEEGFLVPQVSHSACINCGACSRACPAQHGYLDKSHIEEPHKESPAAYGGWNADKDTHLASSSGGIFTALAELVFSAGGCVFGVVWESKDTARFTKAENMEELVPMRGSKYTQAIPGMVYREVKEELKKGRQVLFCGTSCQVYALKRYLRKEYENLLLVDILCHGVPSRHLLQGYIREWEQREGKEITRIQFRDKAKNWQQYHIRKEFCDGSTQSHMTREDMFLTLFIGEYVLNRACYSCVGDITLGDFWGNLHQLHPDWPIRDGIGSLLANTVKGKSTLHALERIGLIQLHPEPLENLLQGQRSTYVRHSSIPIKRESILKRLKTESISRLHGELRQCVQYGAFRFRMRTYLQRGGFVYRLLQKGWRIIKSVTP